MSVALAKWRRAVVLKKSRVTVRLSTGRTLEADLAMGWNSATLPWRGFLVDMTGAYRQVPRSESQRWISWVVFWDWELGKPMAAEDLAMPFGAAAAVNNFNRLGKALLAVFVRKLAILCTQYFDDYSGLPPHPIAGHLNQLLQRAFKTLGFGAECKGEPLAEYASLGVLIDVRELFSKISSWFATPRPGSTKSWKTS